MSKTPEEMAEEYAEAYIESDSYLCSKYSFLAGYKVAQEHAHAALEEAEAKIQELQDQLADADKVMNSSNNSNGWISVKDRLPEEGEEVLVFGQYLNDIPKVLGVKSRYKGDQDWKYTWEGSDEWVYREDDVTHWMPLPEPPKEEK